MRQLKHLLLLSIISASLTIGAFSSVKEVKPDPFINAFATPAYASTLESEPNFSLQYQFNHLNRGDVLDSYRGDGITIAIIDSGINVEHLDFKSGATTNILNTSAYIEEKGSVYSNIDIQTVAAKGISIINDTNGHGTNVAGTIGALVNGVGTAGLSPNVNLLILKTKYQYTEINRAIRYAVDNGADIINMSIEAHENTFTSPHTGNVVTGYTNTSTYFQSNINYAYNKGVTLIGAAGNHNTNDKSYPAANTNVISVGALATDSSTSIASYSNWGTWIDIVAPGGVYVTNIGSSTSYRTNSGTSFAAPLVASAVALYKQKNSSATPAQIQNKLFETTYDLGTSGKDTTFGHGRLDLTEFMAGEEERIPVTGVSLSPKKLNLNIGQTAQLTATITPSDATNQEIIFISNNDDVATVDELSGLVTATGVGTTEIGVLTDDGMFEDSATVTVTSIYTPTLTLNTSGVKTSYTFKESLDLTNLTAEYLSISGQVSQLSYSDLTLVSGDTDALGTSSLVFSYNGLQDSFDIMVTNVGSEQGDKESGPKNISIKGNNATPLLNTSTGTDYANVEFGGKNFSGGGLRNLNDVLFIAKSGYIYNKDPLDFITSITINYASGGSAKAVQTFYFSNSAISTTSGLSATKTLSTSTAGTTSTVTAPDQMSYFRMNISSDANLQAEIIVNYQGGGVLRFTDLEQTNAYYDYFMSVTHEECLVRNVTSSTWMTLKNEYNAMVDEAKTLLSSSNYGDLEQRYLLILNEYSYDDFMNLSKTSLFSKNYAFVSEHQDEIIIITVLISASVLSLLTYAILRRKKDKAQ